MIREEGRVKRDCDAARENLATVCALDLAAAPPILGFNKQGSVCGDEKPLSEPIVLLLRASAYACFNHRIQS
jgi:hypothetical protein